MRSPGGNAAPPPGGGAMLSGRRLLITGVLNRHSIAFATASRAQELGAEVLLTGFGRTKRITERAAAQLPRPAEVVELDVNSEQDLARIREQVQQRLGGLDGVLHAIAHAPLDALGGAFLDAPRQSALSAYETSAYSLKALVAALLPLLQAAPEGAGVVGLDFDASVAWPAYDWMGVAKAALEAVARYLARDLGAREIRVNLVSAGPIETLAAGGIPGFAELAGAWSQTAPLRWDASDPSPVADACCFLFSPLARAITGEVLHVDGGYHAMGAPRRESAPPASAPARRARDGGG
jgi:meromycolic acid enoyl-[acyl-carrier-protein] reductase